MSGIIKLILMLMLIKAEINCLNSEYYVIIKFPCPDIIYIVTRNSVIDLFGPFYFDIRKEMTAGTEIRILLNKEAAIVVESNANLTKVSNVEYNIILLEHTNHFKAFIKRIVPSTFFFVQILSVKINGLEYCGYHDIDPEQTANGPTCGKRKISHNQLIVFGSVTKPGDWPWHVALNRIHKAIFRYVCGGTLISDIFVITAAHCVTKNGVAVLPESIGVSLGKHNLIGGDKDPQEREVFKVIVHEKFEHKKLDNDIALLKLSTAAVFNDYIQPACLWFDLDIAKIPSGEIIGAVSGWGFDQSNSLSTELRYTKMPIVQDITCIRRKPMFYASFMNGKRFCAGVLNGTSACNGDSGGGFMVLIPDTPNTASNSDAGGTWFIRGIASLGYSRQDDSTLCDPNEYVLFTDIDQYKEWIKDHVK